MSENERFPKWREPPETCPACGLADADAFVSELASTPFRPQYRNLPPGPHVEWTCSRCGYAYRTAPKEPV